MKSLTDRLSVMLCPRWLATPTQPIAVDDVMAYLLAARELATSERRIFEIGSMECGDLRRFDSRIRSAKRTATLADLRPGSDAILLWAMVGIGDTDQLRCWSSHD